MHKKIFFASILGICILQSCNSEKKEELISNVNKNGAVETVLAVEHIDTADVLVTKHKIWKNNKLYKEIIQRDTIASLGDTVQSHEDKDGVIRPKSVKKDYEFYITVQ